MVADEEKVDEGQTEILGSASCGLGPVQWFSIGYQL